MKGKLFPAAVVCLFLLAAAQAQTKISVDEDRSSAVLTDKAFDVSLVIGSGSGNFREQIALELLDEENRVRLRASQFHLIKKGENSYKISLPLADPAIAGDDNLAWYRLRYRVGTASGVVSLSELIADIFKLRVIATDNLFSGMIYRARIKAENPFTGKAVRDVKIGAGLELELKDRADEKLKLSAGAVTDREGFAVIDFQIPAAAELGGDGEIAITGRKGGIVREAKEELNALEDDFSFLILTDKPIYQPEQTLNLRGILLKGADAPAVVSGEEIEFRIEDEEGTVLYRETLNTSEFGIAAAAWTIPSGARLGDYSIEVRRGGDQIGYQKVKVSRYDLPNFAVSAKPDKPFYLPGDGEAGIEIRADYLFGKPVTKGRVRVVMENSREWNWKEQRYDIDEGQTREGETDREGKFIARFDLGQAHEDLEEDEWRRFRDLNFAAYFTDPTTNRTEQKRFDVRVTKEAIHVYFIGDRYGRNPRLPVDGFVSTFYADGSPAVCDVAVAGSEEDEDKFKTLQRVKTNSYGAARLDFKRPAFEDEDADMDLKIVARDKNGKTGSFADEIYFDEDEDALLVKTDKSIYKPGETVRVNIGSTFDAGLVYIDVVKGWSVVESFSAELKNGKAEIKIPYRDKFQGELKIAVFYEDEDEEMTSVSRGIIFPSPQNLRLDAEFEKAVYKPGEEASVSFRVFDNIGRTVESALGVVIFDRAVEERARTDGDFGGMFRNLYGWLGYGGAFGGVNVKDLNDLDLTKPISDELQLVADVILYDSYYDPNIFHSRNYETDARSVYAGYFKKQFDPLEMVLKKTYDDQNFRHPVERSELDRILAENGLNLESLRDPWAQSYRAAFQTVKTQDVLKIVSAGADKKFDTADDLTVSSSSFTYFTPTGRMIDAAVKNFHERTGGFIRDEKTLLAELGVIQMLDRFGRPYRFDFDTAGKHYRMTVRSAGPDGAFEQYYWRGDDFTVWTNSTDYFAATETKIQSIFQKTIEIPSDEKTFAGILSKNGLDLDEIRDGYGREIYLARRQFSRYTDKAVIETIGRYGEEKRTQRTTVTPVTQEVLEFTLRSAGADGRENTSDDFTLAQFLFVLSEQTKDEPAPQMKNIVYTSGTGAIGGTVTDAGGAVIPAATVTATGEESTLTRSVTADENGKYLIGNLAAGNYSVTVEAANFTRSVRSGVPVKSGSTTVVDFVLEVGSVSEVVTVSAESNSIQSTTNASVVSVSETRTTVPSLVLNEADAVNLQKNLSQQPKDTPRLREYFPETLVWSPELLTDREGRAALKFKMADNITTWKLYTIASTKSGKIGVAEKEVQAFQNFFVDLDPPKFLTAGDEIYLPTQVRNYTDAKQSVEVSMAEADWFDFLSPENQRVEVASGASESAVFGFRARRPVKDGRQKVTAVAAAADSDAIERGVTVKPNGREIVETETKLFESSAGFEIDFPAGALADTPRAELKIYPNLLSHVTESVEGLLQRPYGCGEQTISSTYPNLMILKFAGQNAGHRRSAGKYLQKGYERLLGYQVSNGGFSYWGGRDAADIALTAYAIRFLSDARGFIEVDAGVIEKAQNWLVTQQRADGSFTRRYYYENSEDPKRTILFTAYVARTLAMHKTETAARPPAVETAIKKALDYLKTRNAGIDEPYALALYGLAALDTGNTADAQAIAAKLEAMAISEGERVYWNLETNTPFYGWGTPGRIETTALVLQLLIKTKDPKPKTKNPKPGTGDLISRATLFLLKNKDRYGVWHSTQTTINVLDAFLAALAADKPAAPQQNEIRVLLNGAAVSTLRIAPGEIAPQAIDLTKNLNPASNKLEVSSSGDSPVMAQIVRAHYIDWRDAEISDRNINRSRQIRLGYRCDRQTAAVMQEISCRVEAERVGFKGYGMLLAEIGIPPGADVSRETLEKALENDSGLSRYDVLPDRIIFYMWAHAGGTRFDFKFRPRYRISAQTPASVVYDYYNDEARAIVAPLKFTVNK